MMRRKVLPIVLTAAVLVGAVALGIATPAAADKGGCPSEAASNGAAHANAMSAHGVEKQTLRGCSGGEPTAEPTPTPAPADEADVSVTNVSVSAPDTGSVQVKFPVFVGASLLNLGPANDVQVDTDFTLNVPPDCSVSTATSATVEDTSLPKGVGVYVSVGWLVTCSQPGDFTFTADVTVAIDPLEPMSDPDLSNNSGSGSDMTTVGP